MTPTCTHSGWSLTPTYTYSEWSLNFTFLFQSVLDSHVYSFEDETTRRSPKRSQAVCRILNAAARICDLAS